MICTGRSDYPNQVNNVLCFPYIFRGALDVGATTINEAMKLAAVDAHRRAAPRRHPTSSRSRAYGGEAPTFGAGASDPAPVRPAADPRCRRRWRKAAMEFGRRDDADRRSRGLSPAAERIRVPLRPHHEAGVRPRPRRPQARGLCRGRGRRVLRATQVVVDEGLARPILIGRAGGRGRPHRAARALASRPERDFELSIPRTIRATATTGRSITGCWSGAASRPTTRAPWCAPTRP